jgi:DNA-dependent RNA polymerase auxiliary subunit epsilon
MERHETRIADGTLYIEADDEWLTVGEMDDIYELMGGETYTIEYDERQRTQSWLDTDEDGRLTFDVRKTLAGMSYDDEFVSTIAGASLDESNEAGYSHRTSLFADLMKRIWDSKGNLDRSAESTE